MPQKQNRLKLKQLSLKGFKSFDSRSHTIDFGDTTVLIGANGAGKSNLVSFFKMLNYMMTGALRRFVAENDFDALLHLGFKHTNTISAELKFENEKVSDKYSFTLAFASGRFVFLEEGFSYHKAGAVKPQIVPLPSLAEETGLREASKVDQSAHVVYLMLRKCQYFQFHDTGATSKIRSLTNKDNNEFLYADGGNLSAYLYAMKNHSQEVKYYERIVKYIQQVMPQFGDFDLRENVDNRYYVRLNWKQLDNDYVFSPSQISDGSLRFMALATLLLQSPDKLPNVIIIDEPELGLHPAAISTFAAMVRIAAENSQIILATQSPTLLDEFNANEVVVIERNGNSSEFHRKSETELNDWLSNYSLSDLWEKNVLGGQP